MNKIGGMVGILYQFLCRSFTSPTLKWVRQTEVSVVNRKNEDIFHILMNRVEDHISFTSEVIKITMNRSNLSKCLPPWKINKGIQKLKPLNLKRPCTSRKWLVLFVLSSPFFFLFFPFYSCEHLYLSLPLPSGLSFSHQYRPREEQLRTLCRSNQWPVFLRLRLLHFPRGDSLTILILGTGNSSCTCWGG